MDDLADFQKILMYVFMESVFIYLFLFEELPIFSWFFTFIES